MTPISTPPLLPEPSHPLTSAIKASLTLSLFPFLNKPLLHRALSGPCCHHNTPSLHQFIPRTMIMKRKFSNEPADRRWYGVRAGYRTGAIQGWQNCLDSVRGYEGARCKLFDEQGRGYEKTKYSPSSPLTDQRFPNREAAERWCAMDDEPQSRPTTPLSPTSPSSDSGALFSGRTSSPGRSALRDRLRRERNINTIRELLRNLNAGEMLSITRGEGEFDFTYTVGSNPRSLN